MPRKNDGFTVVELIIVLLVASVVVTLSIGTFVSQTRLRNQFDEVEQNRERQALALNAIGDWIDQASAVLGCVGTVDTDPHTLNLELPDRDTQGFREAPFDTVTIQASGGNVAIAILPASGSVRTKRAYVAVRGLAAVTFTCLDADGNQSTADLGKTRSIQVRIGPTVRTFALGV